MKTVTEIAKLEETNRPNTYEVIYVQPIYVKLKLIVEADNENEAAINAKNIIGKSSLTDIKNSVKEWTLNNDDDILGGNSIKQLK